MSASAITIKPKKQSFHATNVWNELVAGFRSKIELRKYRRNYFTQTYEQCFTSLDAINCMINILKSHPNFETKQIEKHHAIRLLEKFYESKIFTDVIKTERKKTFVADNGIYQLLSKLDENVFQSMVNTTKTTDSQINSSQESSTSAISDSWKQYFLERLEKYLLKTRNRHGGYLLHQIEQEMKLIDGSQILTNLNNNIPTDPLTIAGQLVDWLPESMLIVIDYPLSLDGRNLPDYPSFIFDLFEMVVDTFEMQRQYLTSSMTIFNLIIQLIANKGNPVSIESLYDRDDSRSVYCFPSEIYGNRPTNNPYTSLKNRSSHSKQSSRGVYRVDSYDYKKISSHHDNEKFYGLTNLRRKSISSCDLFHVTSKTLTSPFDEIQNWLNNKHLTTNNQEKMNNDEFELIQLALIHLTSSNRQFIYVILFFLTQCIRNTQFCSSDTTKLRIYRSFTKLITINHDENTCLNNLFDCFIEHYGKLFDISIETKKLVARRLTKSKKENKPINLTTSNKKTYDDRQFRQTFKQLRISRPLTYNEHLDTDVHPMGSTTFVRKQFLPSPSIQTNEKTCLTSTNSPRRRARSFEPRAHTTTLFDKTINPFHKLRVILKRNE